MTQYKDDDSKKTTCVRADSIHDLEPNTISLNMITESMNSSALRTKDNRTDGLFAWQSPGSPPNPITVYEKRWFPLATTQCLSTAVICRYLRYAQVYLITFIMCMTLTCLLMARKSRYCAPRLRYDFEILRTSSPIAVAGRSNAAAQLFG